MTFWRYDGPSERVYVSVPVTVSPGDVIERNEVPAEDGWWSEVGKVGDGRLVRPDNEALAEADAMISTTETPEE